MNATVFSVPVAAKLITAANVFAHIGDVHGVVDGILELLGPKGVFISENHYLGDLIRTLQYDTIYHEHLRYYSVGSLNELFGRHGMEIFHVRRIPTHGGSIRVYSARKGERKIEPSVKAFLDEEREPTRLGRSVATGVLDDDSMARTIRALQSFRQIAAESPGLIFELATQLASR